jgi:glucan phosphoethanolaminetransferase (alkaline phosphatase superfamily)
MGTQTYIAFFTLNVILSYFIAETGRTREIGSNKSFWISVFFGFFIGSIITISSRQLDPNEREGIKENVMQPISQFLAIYITLALLIGLLISVYNYRIENAICQKIEYKYEDLHREYLEKKWSEINPDNYKNNYNHVRKHQVKNKKIASSNIVRDSITLSRINDVQTRHDLYESRIKINLDSLISSFRPNVEFKTR